MRFAVALCVCCLVPSVGAVASPISRTGGATVKKGVLATEFRTGFTSDSQGASSNNRLQTRQQIDYGFTDYYAARLVIKQDKRQSRKFEHNSVTFSNRFQIFDRKVDGFDGGFRLLYEQADGDKLPHKFTFRVQTQMALAENWEWKQGSFFTHQVGAQSRKGVKYELRNFVDYTFSTPLTGTKKTSLGVEMFNDIGLLRDVQGYNSMEHQIGPILTLGFGQGVKLAVGYRHGISYSAANHDFLMNLQKKF